MEKLTSAVLETDLSRHNEGPIKITSKNPQYYSAVMYEWFVMYAFSL